MRILKSTLASVVLAACMLGVEARAACWTELVDSWSVCVESNWGGVSCEYYFEYGTFCESGGGYPPPGGGGGGGGGVVCPQFLVTSVTSIERGQTAGFGKLVGSVSAYPPNAIVEVEASGPGAAGVQYGYGPFDFPFPLESVPMGFQTYTVTARSPYPCPPYESAAVGIITRDRFIATSGQGSAPYTYGYYDNVAQRFTSVQVNVLSNGFELYDKFGASPTGNGNEIPLTRTVLSRVTVGIQTLPEFTLDAAGVQHEYVGSLNYLDSMAVLEGPFWGPDMMERITLGTEGAYWYDTHPDLGISSVLRIFLGGYAWAMGNPSIPLHPSEAISDFYLGGPF